MRKNVAPLGVELGGKDEQVALSVTKAGEELCALHFFGDRVEFRVAKKRAPGLEARGRRLMGCKTWPEFLKFLDPHIDLDQESEKVRKTPGA